MYHLTCSWGPLGMIRLRSLSEFEALGGTCRRNEALTVAREECMFPDNHAMGQRRLIS